MKTQFYLSLLMLFSISISYAQNGELIVEQIHHNSTGTELDGMTTYRVFAAVDNPGFGVVSIGGEDNPDYPPAEILTSTSFYQHEYGGSKGSDINTALFELLPNLQWDSYVTIGSIGNDNLGVPFWTNENGMINGNSGSIYTINDPEQNWVGEFENGGDIVMNTIVGGSYFSLPDCEAEHLYGIGMDQLVFLGQFTTNGVFSFCANVQIFDMCAEEYNNTVLYLCADGSSGCTDTNACNYDSTVIEDNGTCVLPGDICETYNPSGLGIVQSDCSCLEVETGCTGASACNYSSAAVLDDNSCVYPGDECLGQFNGVLDYSCECAYTLDGILFQDLNLDGIPQPTEPRIPDELVELQGLGISIYTDAHGEFSIFNLPEDSYSVTAQFSDVWTSFTTDLTQTSAIPQNTEDTFYFGALSDTPEGYPSADINFFSSGNGVPCNAFMNYNVDITPATFEGYNFHFEVEFDPLLTIELATADNAQINGNTVTWSSNDLALGLASYEDILVETPSEQYLGEIITNTIGVTASYGFNDPIPIYDYVLSQEVGCAYDPNIIVPVPAGYGDHNWVLADTRMEYQVHFQNVGNAPASTVLIVDTLDALMDASTFEVVANSHSIQTTILPDGIVEFLFQDINLLDSTTNEPESHGVVTFKIDYIDDIQVDEEIEQTAYIYFDNNPAIVTNTTFHTIHECGGESGFEVSDLDICAGENINFNSTYFQIEDYQWSINDEPTENNADFSQTFSEAGEFLVQLEAENPLCYEATSQLITVYEIPSAEIIEDGAILTANEGDNYQWYLNGEAIENGTEQAYEALEDGNYYVVVTNGNDCSTQSSEVMIVSVSEIDSHQILLYPNPMTSVATLSTNNSREKTITLTDLTGKIVKSWHNIYDQNIEIQKGELSSGSYYLNIIDSKGSNEVLIFLIK